jgi:transcriptional regulator with PAS, ATPase and Fis domain
VEPAHLEISLRRQCELLGVNRSGLYYQPVGESEENLLLMRRIDEEYTRRPFYGSRRMTMCPREQGYAVNRKRVARLMGLMGLAAVYPKPKLSQPGEGHKIYPYLLEGWRELADRFTESEQHAQKGSSQKTDPPVHNLLRAKNGLDNGGHLRVGAVEFFRDISEIERLRKSLEQKRTLEAIVSVNPRMHALIGLLPDVAASECNVLIQGPSGCGKELFAQVIHNLSPRCYGPYVRINCAALPATLLESELFGYEKGAFTDAKRDKPGQFAVAAGGTLLLDEIAEMDMALQVKLLRALNNGEYRPLGSTRTLHADARIIAATNADLGQAIASGKFRQDLYYRINVVNIAIPPLCERPEDIPLLVEHFLAVFRQKSGKPIERVAPEALALLRRHPLPGNVRELENAIEHACIMCHGAEITPEHLPPHITSPLLPRNGDGHALSEQELILQALRRYRGNREKAAAELGMHRSTLSRNMKTLGIAR